jgi:hypothetical protein
MSQAVRTTDRWIPSRETVGGNTAAASELAVRALIGVVGVRALTGAVRGHPWLSLFFAAGTGYLMGNGWGSTKNPRTAKPKDAKGRR